MLVIAYIQIFQLKQNESNYMTREIKFRAWDIFYKKFITSEDNGMSMFWAKVGGGLDAKREVPVMQYTGLKDKTGKEIFEGDILKGETYKEPYAMKTKADIVFAVAWSNHDNGSWNWTQVKKPEGFRTYPPFQFCEIIGNIYENPDLLK